jgi:DME family drug/metabolite transporter
MGAATLWGTTGIVTQAVYNLRPTNALSITFLRLAIAVLVLVLLCWQRLGRRIWQVNRRDALLMLGMGAMQATSQSCYFAAIADCGVTIATLVTICLAPVIVVLLAAHFLRERITGKILLALLGALIGTALLTGAPPGQRTFGSLLVGVLLSLVSAATYAMVILIGRVLSGRYHSLQVSVVSFACGALLLFTCSLLTTPLVLSYPAAAWGLLFYMSVVPTALAYLLFQVGMRSTPATLTSILTFCEPLTAAFLAWLLFGERLSLLGILGAVLLLGAVVLLTLAQPAPVAAQASE